MNHIHQPAAFLQETSNFHMAQLLLGDVLEEGGGSSVASIYFFIVNYII